MLDFFRRGRQRSILVYALDVDGSKPRLLDHQLLHLRWLLSVSLREDVLKQISLALLHFLLPLLIDLGLIVLELLMKFIFMVFHFIFPNITTLMAKIL